MIYISDIARRYSLDRQSYADFQRWLSDKGITTRMHKSMSVIGIDVHHNGHWMAVLFSRNSKMHSPDKRLGPLVQQFIAETKAVVIDTGVKCDE